MAWMDESDTTTSNDRDNIWLKFPKQLKNIGDRTEVKMRILSGDPNDPAAPVGVWVHWLGSKPFNCSRPYFPCAVCDARNEAKRNGVDVKTAFPLKSKSFFNVLTRDDNVSVKVFSFGHGVSRDLKQFYEKYGDLRTYDITVRKSQIGRLAMNVEYSVFYEGKSDLSESELLIAKDVHDLSQYVKPASREDLEMVARGELPERTEDSDQARLISDIRKRIPSDVDLKHFGIDANNPPDTAKLEALLTSLRGE